MWKIMAVACCLGLQALVAAPSVLVGIAGGTGSGKTTLAKNIQNAFATRSVIVSQDSYYKDLSHLTEEERETANFDHPDAIDFALFRSHLRQLQQGIAVDQPIHTFDGRTNHGTRRVEPAELIIVEGILVLAIDEIRELCDLKIFVDVDDDIRVVRRIERDMNERSKDFLSVKEQYLATVKPMHDQFVAPSKQYADLLVPQGGRNPAALQWILGHLRQLWSEDQLVAVGHGL